ncbi:MAG: uracil-DNA glycosylase [Synergistaceae bacterium]|nr:uracil-DNA glycosylase [Synergistaceae bacterium]
MDAITAIENMRKKAWADLQRRVESCQKCHLCRTRQHTVFGEGPKENCRCVIIGEAPGEDEDKTGQPFVGNAGKLLDEILSESTIDRDSLYIMNVLKCRPPSDDPKKKNRPPAKEEVSACQEYLETQLALLHPDIIVTMGNTPTQLLLENDWGITKIHGRWFPKRMIYIYPMFHPSYLLHNKQNYQELRALMLKDAQALKIALDKLKSL